MKLFSDKDERELNALAKGFEQHWGKGDDMNNYARVQVLCADKNARENELLVLDTALAIIDERTSSVHLLLHNHAQESQFMDREIVKDIIFAHKCRKKIELTKIEEELRECIVK